MSEWKTDGSGRRYQWLDHERAGMRTSESGEVWVRRFHPFDRAEYYVAHSADGRQWVIYRDSRERTVRERMQGTPEEVAVRLEELDAEITPHWAPPS